MVIVQINLLGGIRKGAGSVAEAKSARVPILIAFRTTIFRG